TTTPGYTGTSVPTTPSLGTCGGRYNGPSYYRICLYFDFFITESNYDYVLVYDGPDTTYRILGRYSGSNVTTTTVCSSGSSMTVRFTSDSSGTYQGFLASFYSVNDTIANCSKGFFSCDNGRCLDIIRLCDGTTTPGYTGPSYSTICLYFDFFITESNYDYVRVYDGPDTTYRSLGSYSGRNVTTTTVCSSGSSMTVRFTSDSSSTYQGFLASFYSVNDTIANCSNGFFSCDNGRCLDIIRLCDGVLDCYDRSDEHGCSCTGDLVSCSRLYDQCIPASQVCNGFASCKDGSDEKGCDCQGMRCYDGQACYNSSQKCDGKVDCSDKSDEMHCPLICKADEWRCANIQQCIPEILRCNSKKDCHDGTDEYVGCQPPTPAPIIPFIVVLYNLTINITEAPVNKAPIWGRLMVKREGIIEDYGTVCDDSFDTRDASVVCRMLGYGDDTPAFFYSGSVFNTAWGPIWLTNLHCTGTEQNLADCVHAQWGKHQCSHQQDVYVACGWNFFRTENATTTTMRTTSPHTTRPPDAIIIADCGDPDNGEKADSDAKLDKIAKRCAEQSIILNDKNRKTGQEFIFH
ncbi:hypothetical protein DPMN_170762, partial [Dreissena polymorpha]